MALPQSRRLDFDEIPVIDLSQLIEGDYNKNAIHSLDQACRNIGFFYITNHGISYEYIDRLHRLSKAYFAQPASDKEQCRIDHRIRGYLPLGYNSYEGESRSGKSHQEGFWIGYEQQVRPDRMLEGPNRWPSHPPGFKTAMLKYLEEVQQLSETLLCGFSLALGLEKSRLLSVFNTPTSRLKLNHYPPQPNPTRENEIGVVPHSDSGAFTILWQDNHGGLEIQSKSGSWVGAPPMENTLVVNIGNIMQIWSNGRFSSTPHRVINRGNNDRYSIPFFVNPDFDCMIEPLVDNNQSDYPLFNFGEYQIDLWRRSFPVAQIPGKGDLDKMVLSL